MNDNLHLTMAELLYYQERIRMRLQDESHEFLLVPFPVDCANVDDVHPEIRRQYDLTVEFNEIYHILR